MFQKGSVLTSLFDAFGHQRPQKDDSGTTRKFVEKLVSTFWQKYEKQLQKGGGIWCLSPLFFDLFLTWGPDGAPGSLQTLPEVVLKDFGSHFRPFF